MENGLLKVIEIGEDNYFYLYLYDANINKIIPVNAKKDMSASCNYAVKLGSKVVLERLYNPMHHTINENLEDNLESLILLLTSECTINCKYCHQMSALYDQQKNKLPKVSNKFMSKETALVALDYFLKHSTKTESPIISFYGGEPLLCFSMIKELVEFCKTTTCIKTRNIQFLLSTNFTIVSDDMFEFFVENKFKICVSLDGPNYIHDAYRIDNDAVFTHSSVINNLKKLKDMFPDYFTTVTFASVLVDESNYHIIRRYFRESPLFNTDGKINELRIQHLQDGYNEQILNNLINPNKTRGSLRTQINSYKNLEELSKAYTLTFLYVDNLIHYEKNIKLYLMPSLLMWLIDFCEAQINGSDSLNKEDYPTNTCLIGAHKLMVDPDGVYWPCEIVNNSEMIIGNVKDGINKKTIHSLLDVCLGIEDKCMRCFAFRFCDQCVPAIGLSKRSSLCEESRKSIENFIKIYCRMDFIKNKVDSLSIEQGGSNSYDLFLKLASSFSVSVEVIDEIKEPLEKAFAIYSLLFLYCKITSKKIYFQIVMKSNGITELIDKLFSM